MYKIKICKDCGKQWHIHKKNNEIIVKNKCIHFIDVKTIEKQTLPTTNEPLPMYKDIHLCVLHSVPLIFKKSIGYRRDLYYCPQCAEIDKLIPAKFIERLKWGIRFKWERDKYYLDKYWKEGDVKVSTSPDYKQYKKWGLVK